MQSIFQITLLVPDYDDAIQFYVKLLGFELVEDTDIGDSKRWVVVKAVGGCALVLALPQTDEQVRAIGNQTGGRVSFFLGTDDCQRDYQNYLTLGVDFLQAPNSSEYGTVAIFTDPFGNHWDLIEHAKGHRFALDQA